MYKQDNISFKFLSPLGPMMKKFIAEKRAVGYRYNTEVWRLRHLDRLLIQKGADKPALPRELVENWIAKKPHEGPSTHRNRAYFIRRFCEFLARHGIEVFIPDACLCKPRPSFAPRILTRKEVGKILQAADQLPFDGRFPRRHVAIPLIFRVLYGCGLRLGEVLKLRLKDVDAKLGILTIREGKFGKDRLVPMAPSLAARLNNYISLYLPTAMPDDILFPSRDGRQYNQSPVYSTFRQLLWKCKIPHGGRGKGPRLHDLRSTFAVHRLVKWYREGADLRTTLPVLSAYLGHRDMYGTQRYLKMTAEVYPDLSERLENRYGDIIPRSNKK